MCFSSSHSSLWPPTCNRREGAAGTIQTGVWDHPSSAFSTLGDLRSWGINFPAANATFTFITMFCKPKWGSYTKLVEREVCKPFNLPQNRTTQTEADESTSHQGTPSTGLRKSRRGSWGVHWALAFGSITKGWGSVWEEGPCPLAMPFLRIWSQQLHIDSP